MEQGQASYAATWENAGGGKTLRTPGDTSVQIIFSGATDIEGHRLYATVLAPFALGVPGANVQMYCARRFRQYTRETWQASEVFANELAGQRAVVVPDYFQYFLDVMNRAKSGHKGLPDCCIRIVAGHGYGDATGSPYLKCGEKTGLATFGRRHQFLQQLTLVTHREPFVLSKEGPSQWVKGKLLRNLVKESILDSPRQNLPSAFVVG